jgi:hypothetical protein
MIYGPFSLRDAYDAELLFYYWNSSEPDSDYFFWGASINSSNFYGLKVSGNSDGWQYKNFDLTNVYTLGNLCGRDSVWIAFYFKSNATDNNYDGAFVDDIVLQKNTTSNPDLIITSMTPSNSNPEAGDYITVSMVIKNRGTAYATSSNAGLYYNLSSPPDITTWQDKYLPTFSLNPGDSDIVIFSGITSSYATTWNMYGLADCFGAIYETDETNNYIGPKTIVWHEPTPKPDLVFTDVSPSDLSPGVAKYDYLYTTVKVKNSGNASAGSFWTDIFYDRASPPSPPSTGNDWRYTSSLPVGSSNTFTFVTRNDTGYADPWDMYLLLDSFGDVSEQNENNNTYGPVHINWNPKTAYPQRTRDEIINTALEFVNVSWKLNSWNCSPTDSCSDWYCDPYFSARIGQWIQGEAYEWGAWDRPSDFVKLLVLQYNAYNFFKVGARKATDCIPDNLGIGDPFWAIGSDCSGLVSRAWNLSYNCGTTCLDGSYVSNPLLSYVYLLRGDILLDRGNHVAIFYEWAGVDTMEVIEETPPIAIKGKWTSSKYNNYTPYRYKNVLGVPDIPGDANSDGIVSVGDVIWLINYLFKGGPKPNPCWKADVNADCKVSLSDIVWLINYLFKGGPSPRYGCAISC